MRMMTRWRSCAAVGAAVLCLALGSGCGTEGAKKKPPARPDDLTVVFSSDLLGKVRSCGCVIEDMGGLGRWATFTGRIRESVDNLIVVDAGDAFGPELSVHGERGRARVRRHERRRPRRVHAGRDGVRIRAAVPAPGREPREVRDRRGEHRRSRDGGGDIRRALHDQDAQGRAARRDHRRSRRRDPLSRLHRRLEVQGSARHRNDQTPRSRDQDEGRFHRRAQPYGNGAFSRARAAGGRFRSRGRRPRETGHQDSSRSRGNRSCSRRAGPVNT